LESKFTYKNMRYTGFRFDCKTGNFHLSTSHA
jgi:hypothetical protein